MAIKKHSCKIPCLFKSHNWELICWDYKNTMRFENCTRCKKTRKVYDLIGAKFVRDLRVIAWQERRRVIVEKHKYIKSYVLSIEYGDVTQNMLEFKTSDAEYESLRTSLLKTCADADMSADRVHIKCLDTNNEEIPDMFLL